MAKTKIALLYERLSRDDEKSKGRKAKLFFSASIGDAVFALLDSPDKFVVDGNTLFLTLAAASHTSFLWSGYAIEPHFGGFRYKSLTVSEMRP